MQKRYEHHVDQAQPHNSFQRFKPAKFVLCRFGKPVECADNHGNLAEGLVNDRQHGSEHHGTENYEFGYAQLIAVVPHVVTALFEPVTNARGEVCAIVPVLRARR